MTYETGKYDYLATLVRHCAQASGVVVIVIGGIRGSGFSVQSTDTLPPTKLAMLLRNVASAIERKVAAT